MERAKETGGPSRKECDAAGQRWKEKGSEQHKETDHNAMGQRTGGHCQRTRLGGHPDCFVKLDCSAGSDGS